MLKDFREQDATPDEGERDWMDIHPLAILVRILALAGIALAIGVSTSEVLQGSDSRPAAKPAASTP